MNGFPGMECDGVVCFYDLTWDLFLFKLITTESRRDIQREHLLAVLFMAGVYVFGSLQPISTQDAMKACAKHSIYQNIRHVPLFQHPLPSRPL